MLKMYHNHFVVSPIYNAPGNVPIICKRFYALTLIKEFRWKKGSNDHETCKICDQVNKDQIYSIYIQHNFNLDFL